jgi:hypothetical protein
MFRGKSVVYCTDRIAASSFSDVFDDHEHEQAPEAQTTSQDAGSLSVMSSR